MTDGHLWTLAGGAEMFQISMRSNLTVQPYILGRGSWGRCFYFHDKDGFLKHFHSHVDSYWGIFRCSWNG